MLHHEIDWWMDLATRKKTYANRTIEGSLEVGATAMGSTGPDHLSKPSCRKATLCRPKTSYAVHFPSPVPRETATVN
jgi:hypothetical protein